MASSRWWWLLGLLVAASWPAQAATYCVDSVAELQSALDSASASADSDLIQIERGSYAIPTGLSYRGAAGVVSSGALRVRGGFDDGCSGEVAHISNTVFDGQDAGEVALVAFFDLRDSLTLSNLNFIGISELYLDTVDCDGGGDLDIALSRVRVASSQSGFAISADCADVRLENVIASDNQVHGVYFVIGAEHRFTMIHATLTGNATGLYALNANASPPRPIRVYNSILYGNTAADINANGSSDWFNAHSTFATGGATLPGFSNSAADPQLDAGGRPLEPGSPAINSGTAAVFAGLPGIDVVGRARDFGGAADRGAYESSVSAGTTLTVTNTNDSGSGSLRAAILAANGSTGLQRIHFAIPGQTCPHVIDPDSALPAITGATLIDGYTQSGSVENASALAFDAEPCVVLRNPLTFVQSLAHGLVIDAGSGGEAVTVRGLAFSGFASSSTASGAIRVVSGRGHAIQGNQFGGAVGGFALVANINAVVVDGPAHNLIIGGSQPAHRNLLSASTRAGVLLQNGANRVQIVANLIGLHGNGFSALPNGVGVTVQNAPGNVLLANAIGFNAGHGVHLWGHDSDATLLLDNRIGLRPLALCFPLPCTPDHRAPNGGAGVLISRRADDPIEGRLDDSTLRDNTIAYNVEAGVSILDGLRHRVSGEFRDNGALALDLGVPGPDPIDDDVSQPLYPNFGLNAPVLLDVVASLDAITVSGLLSTRGGTHRLEFYANEVCDPSGYGEAERAIEGSLDVDVVGSGGLIATPFEVTLRYPSAPPAGFVTAIARDTDGNTSEFSACLAYERPLFRDGFEEIP